MSNAAGENPTTLSGWKGIEQRIALCDAQHVLDAFNVEFIDGTIARRLGRQKLIDTQTVRPTVVALFISVGTWTDFTVAATDGDLVTTAITNPWNGPTNALYIGSPYPFQGLNFTLTSATTGTATLFVSYFNRAAGGTWTNLTIVDGTASGGTMKQTGSVTWTMPDLQSQWSTGNDQSGDPVATPVTAYQDLYWVKLTTSPASISGGNIAEISLSYTGTNSLRSESYGMVEFATRGGARLLCSAADYPGYYDANFAVPNMSRVFIYDLGRGDLVPVRIPPQAKWGGSPGQRTSFVTFNGWLLGASSNGVIWKFDGTTAGTLEGLVGMDAQNHVIGASAYTAVPVGTMLEVYRNRLVVAGNPLAPMQFQLSIEDNNVTQIPASATVGGPNVWPLRYVFNVPGKDGDRITGISVINDRLCILTRSQLWIFDDTSLKVSNPDIGCLATGSVQRIDNRIFFLSDWGVFAWDGVNAQLVSGPVIETLRSQVNWRAIQNCTSAHDKVRSEYVLWLPINGEFQNQIAIIYNYLTDSWRITGGWYPWDTDAARDASLIPMQSITAATTIRGSDGKQTLITCDSSGIIWNENIAYEENGAKVAPGYVVFPIMGNAENYQLSREWYVMADMDGSNIEAYQLADGERFDQEVDREANSVATNSQTALKLNVLQNTVPGGTTLQYNSNPSWPVNTAYVKRSKVKLSFARNLTKLQAALRWKEQSGPLGRGKIYELQIGAAPKVGGR